MFDSPIWNTAHFSDLSIELFLNSLCSITWFSLLEVQLSNNVMLVSGDSVIHVHVSILFQVLFPFRLLQNIEQSS